MMAEAAAAAAADGITLSEADCREMFDLISQFDSIKTSMLVDFEHNRPLELEQICGAVLNRSRSCIAKRPHINDLSTTVAPVPFEGNPESFQAHICSVDPHVG